MSRYDWIIGKSSVEERFLHLIELDILKIKMEVLESNTMNEAAYIFDQRGD